MPAGANGPHFMLHCRTVRARLLALSTQTRSIADHALSLSFKS